MYGAEVWDNAMNKKIYRKGLAQVQRRGALRVTSAYRTFSEPAVMVVAGVVPIGLLAKERGPVHVRKSEIGKEMTKHQERLRNLESL